MWRVRKLAKAWRRSGLACLALTCTQALAQSAPDSVPQSPSADESRILPPLPEAPGGGNPLQGLGRPDDSAGARRSPFESQENPTDKPPDSSTSVEPPNKDESDTDKEKEKEKEEKKKSGEEKETGKTARALIDTPLKKAVLNLQLRKYNESLTILNQILETNPKTAEAHYLKGVVLVLTHHYIDAESEYRLALKYDPSPSLTRRAKAGLMKLAR